MQWEKWLNVLLQQEDYRALQTSCFQTQPPSLGSLLSLHFTHLLSQNTSDSHSTSTPIFYLRGWSLITQYEKDSPTLALLFYFPLLLLFRSHDLFYLFIFTSLRYKLPKIRVLFYAVVSKYLLNPEIHLLLQARRLKRVLWWLSEIILVFFKFYWSIVDLQC